MPTALTGIGLGLGNYLTRLRAGRAGNQTLTWIGIGLSALAFVITIIFAIVLAAVILHYNSVQ